MKNNSGLTSVPVRHVAALLGRHFERDKHAAERVSEGPSVGAARPHGRRDGDRLPQRGLVRAGHQRPGGLSQVQVSELHNEMQCVLYLFLSFSQ